MAKRKYQFTVKGLPPKKDGAQSMWGKLLEAKRLIELRQATLNALQENSPLRTNIKLALKIHIGPINDRSIGDLDTFITGVCDGLMAANPRANLGPIWESREAADIYPDRAIGIIDDSQVVSIQAEKIIYDTDQPWYEVILECE